MNVSDFRPMSCCNVLYKIIAKLIVQRLSVVLDKLISPCQAAFVPGRSIGDNIMLAQELFTGYNQARLPPRCALKVDIRKAYDTVEWDFLIAVMELFGFPAKFDNLFSFHWKCDATRVFQLGFADDLLLFCRADMDSIGVFKTGLDRFAEWSGLRLNVQKSHLIISRSAQVLREEMLAALGFQEGFLPMRYLGLPLLSSRLTISDCRPLLLKIDKRIARWEGMNISYAGAIEPQYGLNGFTMVGYETPPFGQFGSMEAHGVGGKFYAYEFSSALWSTIRSETGGDSTFGRTHGITLDLLETYFHGDRGYSE
ncbi:UNVERIFIED_CONTAM: hypothetical protein Sindi_1671700 [Sesamum indicum]